MFDKFFFPGLADDDSDAGEQNGNVGMVEKKVPLPVCNEKFIVKKFRVALQRGDCITGECFLCPQMSI